MGRIGTRAGTWGNAKESIKWSSGMGTDSNRKRENRVCERETVAEEKEEEQEEEEEPIRVYLFMCIKARL